MTTRNIPSPKIRGLALALLACESPAGDSSEEMPAAFRVSEKLRRPLTTLTGVMGFRALLARALTLAKAQAPQLGAIQIKPDGSLEGFNGKGFSGPLQQDPSAEAPCALVAQLLGLLVAFIGEGMTLNLVLDVWPDLPVSDREPWRKNDHDSAR